MINSPLATPTVESEKQATRLRRLSEARRSRTSVKNRTSPVTRAIPAFKAAALPPAGTRINSTPRPTSFTSGSSEPADPSAITITSAQAYERTLPRDSFSSSSRMLFHLRRHKCRRDDPAIPKTLAAQVSPKKLAHLAAQPIPQRHTESLLGPCDQPGRQTVADRLE